VLAFRAPIDMRLHTILRLPRCQNFFARYPVLSHM